MESKKYENLEEDILEVLKENKKQMSLQEIAEKMELSGDFEKYLLLPYKIASLEEKKLISYNIYNLISGKSAIWLKL